MVWEAVNGVQSSLVFISISWHILARGNLTFQCSLDCKANGHLLADHFVAVEQIIPRNYGAKLHCCI